MHPIPESRPRTFEAILLDCDRLSAELAQAAFDDQDAAGCAALRDLSSLLSFVAMRLGDFAPIAFAPAPEALELFEPCLCGRDRGEHLADSPHPSDGSDDGEPPCPGYAAARVARACAVTS